MYIYALVDVYIYIYLIMALSIHYRFCLPKLEAKYYNNTK